MKIKSYIHQHSVVLSNICKKHQVDKLWIFGSSVTPKFSSESDIDLLVELYEHNPLKKGELLLSLWDELEEFFERKVDLVTPDSIKNPFLIESINSSKLLIYDGSAEKVFV